MGNKLFLRAVILLLLGLIPLMAFPHVFTPKTIVMGLAVITLLHWPTYLYTAKKINDPNPNALIRTVMAGTMIKFLLSIVAVGIWLYQTGGNIHKPDLYWLMGVYFFFTLFDAILLSGEVRKQQGK